MIVLSLPMPISSNAYWRSKIVNTKDRGQIVVVYVSDEARMYKEQVKWYAVQVGIREPLAGRVWVDLKLYPKRPLDWALRTRKDPLTWDNDVRRMDLDNARKVLMDALQGSVFGNDALIFRDSGEVMEPDEHGPRVVVTIRQIKRVIPQQSLLEADVP